MEKDKPENVLGERLQPCSFDPVTGFFRDGACNTCAEDEGSHTVCAIMTKEFLAFSKYLGNDLSTPRPEYLFQGLKPGDWSAACRILWPVRTGKDAEMRLGLDAALGVVRLGPCCVTP